MSTKGVLVLVKYLYITGYYRLHNI